MDCLILRFDAPLMSFGGVMVDQHGPTDRFPGVSLLAGLCGNALGLSHADATALDSLQLRIEFAARWDRAPKPLLDYQTVDLGQPKMSEPGWTTRGSPEHRSGAPAAAFGTHQRYRHYWADGIMTVALALQGDGSPDLEGVEHALRFPSRPLFLGRKTCLPAAPLLIGRTKASDVLKALQSVPRAVHPGPRDDETPMEACWPAHLGSDLTRREVAVYDWRDWRNQIHTGRRMRREGILNGSEASP